MKDYTETDFQKKMFITRYIINLETNQIEVIYADGIVDTIPYSLHNEIMILERMKRQVLNYNEFKDNAKLDRVFFRIKKYLCLGGAMFGTVVLAHLGVATFSAGIVGIAMIPTLTINGLMILIMKKYFDKADDSIIEINDAIKDYDKSMYYIKNEDSFESTKLLNPKVLEETPDSIQAVAEERKEYDLPIEVPSINMNTIETLPIKDLKKTVDVVNKPKVLTITPRNKR